MRGDRLLVSGNKMRLQQKDQKYKKEVEISELEDTICEVRNSLEDWIAGWR